MQISILKVTILASYLTLQDSDNEKLERNLLSSNAKVPLALSSVEWGTLKKIYI